VVVLTVTWCLAVSSALLNSPASMCLRCLIRGRFHAAAHRASLPLEAPVNVAVAAMSGDSTGGMTSAPAAAAPKRQHAKSAVHLIVDDSQYNR
jgi:hypothetical protein